MATLDELMTMNGVIAAGQFSDDGTLVDSRGQLQPEVAQAAAQFCGGEHAVQNHERFVSADERRAVDACSGMGLRRGKLLGLCRWR